MTPPMWLSRETLWGLDLDEPFPESPDDAPAAHVGAAEMAKAQVMITQSGVLALLVMVPLATSAKVSTPIVFWASFVPWASATKPPERAGRNGSHDRLWTASASRPAIRSPSSRRTRPRDRRTARPTRA